MTLESLALRIGAVQYGDVPVRQALLVQVQDRLRYAERLEIRVRVALPCHIFALVAHGHEAERSPFGVLPDQRVGEAEDGLCAPVVLAQFVYARAAVGGELPECLRVRAPEAIE